MKLIFCLWLEGDLEISCNLLCIKAEHDYFITEAHIFSHMKNAIDTSIT